MSAVPEEAVLPPSAEEIQAAKVHDGPILHCHQRVHSDLLHQHLVPCCYVTGSPQATAGDTFSGASDWLLSALPEVPARQQGTEEGQEVHG